NLGDAYRRTGQASKALAAYQQSLKLGEIEMARDPRDGVARSRVAYVCARLGDRERAESEVAQALRLSQSSNDSRDTAVWTYEALGRREAALALLRESSDQVLKEAVRRPDLAELHRDSRFQQLIVSRQIR